MTEEQRERFQKAQQAIKECRLAVHAIRDPFGAITPTDKIAEWNSTYRELIVALNGVADLVEGQENLEILEGLPERD